MVYSDLLAPDANINLTGTVTQGLTQLYTGAASMTALNADMDATIIRNQFIRICRTVIRPT
jgi:hypothetical protein